jgi:molybdopterin-guanine dinucleotide biosynthesis protein MobB
MMETMLLSQSEVAVASDGERLQPVFCLVPRSLKEDLYGFLQQGERKIDLWLARHKLAEVDFSDQPQTFVNFNRPEDLQPHPPINAPRPLLGFSAFSGTGKTTLLTELLPILSRRGIRVAVIKHAHHNFDIDKPGKDSYRIREAGARQMLIASSRMMALMQKNHADEMEPVLAELLSRIDSSDIDLILVEGFKHEAFPKIELHRPSLGKPLLFKDDPHIIAIASDANVPGADAIDRLDLNDLDAIADYVEQFIRHWTA